jgi:RNA polymerase sigma-70 factor (ECF subfamily)
VLQNSFVKIWLQIRTYDPQKGRLFTWMLRICRNTALDALKSPAVKNLSKIQSTDSIVSIPGDGRSERLTDTIGVSSAVKGLDKEYQEVIDLIYFNGYTHAEAAEALSLPLGTVKTRVRSALHQLRKTFNNHE